MTEAVAELPFSAEGSWPFSPPAGEDAVLSWRAFHLGVAPGIHPSRWPSEIPPDLREILSRDHRAVSLLFGEGNPESRWVPSWHRDDSHPTVALLLGRPTMIPTLHLLLCGAMGRYLLPKIISSRKRRHLLDFLGSDILGISLGVMSRWELPDLSTWLPLTEEAGVDELSKAGGAILMGALVGVPKEFQRQILLCLPGNADPGLLPDDERFRAACISFLGKVARHAGFPEPDPMDAAG